MHTLLEDSPHGNFEPRGEAWRFLKRACGAMARGDYEPTTRPRESRQRYSSLFRVSPRQIWGKETGEQRSVGGRV